MKKFLTILMLACGMTLAASAQETRPAAPKKQNQGQRLEAEKIAFITSQLDLSVEEAQAFWPVYNKVEASQKALNKKQRECYKALQTALKEQKPEKEVDKALEEYIKASQSNVNMHMKAKKEYEKVLPAQKVAKFYVIQEKFRRMQINNLRGGQHKGGPKPGAKPQNAQANPER